MGSTYLVYLGIFFSRIYTHYSGFKSKRPLIFRWIAFGVFQFIIALLFQFGKDLDEKTTIFSIEAAYLPINKNLWTLSFALLLSSFAYILLSILYIIMDIYQYWEGRPFYFMGMNSMLLYLLHDLLGKNGFPFDADSQCQRENDTHSCYLTWNLVSVGIYALIAVYAWSVDYYFVV